MSQDKNIAFQAGLWYVVSSVMVKAVSLLTTPIFTRILSQTDYGITATFSSWYALLLTFCTLNLTYSIGRAKLDFPGKLEEYISSMQLLSAVVTGGISLVLLVFLKPVSRFLELDPRMKLLLVVVFASATFSAPNLLALIWMYLLVVVLYLARGLWLGAKKTAMLFAVFLLINLILSFVPQSKFAAGVGMILFMLERVVVFFVMGAWMGSKLRVSDFVTAMQNMHVPKGGTIALAVAFRYIPTVQDEFRSIKNTMMLRGIGLTVRNVLLHPVKTCEYAIVPLIIRSMTISDELAASAVTRGLDLESKRTSYREVRLRATDFLYAGAVISAVIAGITGSALLGR